MRTPSTLLTAALADGVRGSAGSQNSRTQAAIEILEIPTIAQQTALLDAAVDIGFSAVSLNVTELPQSKRRATPS